MLAERLKTLTLHVCVVTTHRPRALRLRSCGEDATVRQMRFEGIKKRKNI